MKESSGPQKRIESLMKEIEKHRILYHTQDAPEISDENYDSLFRQLEALEERHPEYASPLSPTKRVGGEILDHFEKVPHEVPQWSFDNVFSYEELLKWEERNTKILEKAEIFEKPTYMAELKIDGLKVILTYEEGRLVRAATRGDGKIGEDITENIKTVKTIPLLLKKPVSLTVIGEAWMKKTDLERINKEQVAAGLPPYANTRNLTAGTLRLLDTKIVAQRNIRIFAYDIENANFPLMSQKEELETLKDLGFLVSTDSRHFTNLLGVEKYYKTWVDRRNKEEFGIDGMVIKINENNLWDTLGYTAKSPRGGIAYKFPGEEAATLLESIILQVGRTGAITPVALLEGAFVYGSFVRRATLHNEAEIERLDARVGDTVVIKKAGDVIPEVVRTIPELRPAGSTPFVFPKTCPSCGEVIKKEVDSKGVLSAAYFCKNENCPAKHLEYFSYFVSKKAFNIDGLGEKSVEFFVGEGLLKTPLDIFTLKKEDVMYLEGFGEKSADNLIEGIEKSKDISLAKCIYALGIRHIGEESAKVLAQHFKAIENILSATAEDFLCVPGIGKKSAEELFLYFSNPSKRDFVFSLLGHIRLKSEENKKVGQTFLGKTFVLTGTLKDFSREEVKKIIEQEGGKVSSSVSSKTSYLLAGEAPGSKYTEAEKVGVKILTEEDFLSLLSKK
jgi:DNA ligase (NAD+)